MSQVVWHESKVSREDRRGILKQSNKVLWLTGLSGSGKSTIATAIDHKMHQLGVLSYILDGDNIRHGLNKDLGFKKEDRDENIRRITEVAKILHDAGIFTIVAFISPYKKVRQKAKDIIGEDFIEVHVDCSLEECEQRDTKGLYKKARSGEIKDFTGISAPYEEPENPDIKIDTEKEDAETCAEKVLTDIGIIRNQ